MKHKPRWVTVGDRKDMALNLYGHSYRIISRLLHRFDLHYMRRLPVIEKDKQQIWCEWCGARYTRSLKGWLPEPPRLKSETQD